jgi:3-methyl-2-oxobutanoate hydroxymethyltransferase
MMQEGGAKMVKLEGGREQASIVEYLAVRGVPVCAHLGLQPQFIHKMGAFKVQGRDEAAAEAMLHDAKVLTEAGADLLVLECVPASLGKRIAEASSAPVIGIGAGPDVHGQILVLQDILNISPLVTLGRRPRFVQNFMQGAPDIESAIRAYSQAVKSGKYPAPEHCF